MIEMTWVDAITCPTITLYTWWHKKSTKYRRILVKEKGSWKEEYYSG
jgi:hypothetical protein